MNIPLNTPLGAFCFNAEMTKRSLGTSINKAQAFVWDEVLETYLLIYEDISEFMGDLVDRKQVVISDDRMWSE